MDISFIGLGKLGLPLACLLANNNKVLCVDKNEYVLSKLLCEEFPFFEPDLNDCFQSSKHNIVGFTDSYSRITQETEAAIILVNTQLGNSGYASDFVESAVIDLAVNLRKSKREYFTIILSSTILPGSIQKLIHTVEKISKRKYKSGFGLTYVPDFVKLGSVIHDFKNPEFFLIGSNHTKDTNITKKIFNNLHTNNCPYFYLTLEEAEIAKISLNAFIVNKITFANFLGRLCEGLDNVNIHNITQTIGIDKRISPHFFKSGTPYGGTCFPRDASAFVEFARNRNFEAKNLLFAEEVNGIVLNSILNSAKSKVYKSVGILGLSFKPNSPVTIGSPSVIIAERLLKENKTVYGYDEIPDSWENLNIKIQKCISAQDCIDKSDLVIVMHPDNKFSHLRYTNTTVLDYWGIVKQ